MEKKGNTLSYPEAERAKASTADGSNKGDEHAKRIRLKSVCKSLNNNNEGTQIVEFVRTQIKDFEHLVGGVGFIDYIKNNLVGNPDLTIWGRGNGLLNKNEVGNLFELLDSLKLELSKVDYNRQNQTINSEPQQANNEQTTGELNLPSELNTDKAKKLLQKLIDKDFCDEGFKWNKPKALLAYFADKASEYLNLGKGQKDERARISWKPFEALFSIQKKSGEWIKAKGLSGARNDYQKTGILPCNYKDIDNLF
jgi:hypothetical protein